MRFATSLPLLFASSLAVADSIGPVLGPTDRTLVAEQPCDRDTPRSAEPIVGRYMCQIGINGEWFQTYACEIIKSSATSGYLRGAKWNVPCSITATVTNRRLGFSGWMSCEVTDPITPNLVSDDAELGGKLQAIPGGFRIATKASRHRTIAHGSPDAIPRPVTIRKTRQSIVLNVCRTPWPAGFVSDIERAEAIERARHRP
ncbi:MAG: hypothetical protein ACKV2T_05750 [Kofleriaceae bacterium]